MRYLLAILVVALMLINLPAMAQTKAPTPTETKKVEVKVPVKVVAPVPAKEETKAAAAASQPAKTEAVKVDLPPTPPTDVKVPTDVPTAIDSGKDLIGAVQAHRWWFAVAVGIFIVLFLLSLFGLFEKIGTFWAWVLVGILSLAASIFAAFDKGGFSWSTFMGYVTAGPTIAWCRDFIKDAILKKKAAQPESKA